ncbi:MAG: hypothetical protein ABIO92_04320 [Chloroflexia bacterium]
MAAKGKVAKVESAKAGLQNELDTLRASLEQAYGGMGKDYDDVNRVGKMGALVARLCDSIARVEVAQQRLAALDGSSNRLRREVERILREVGLGEL